MQEKKVNSLKEPRPFTSTKFNLVEHLLIRSYSEASHKGLTPDRFPIGGREGLHDIRQYFKTLREGFCVTAGQWRDLGDQVINDMVRTSLRDNQPQDGVTETSRVVLTDAVQRQLLQLGIDSSPDSIAQFPASSIQVANEHTATLVALNQAGKVCLQELGLPDAQDYMGSAATAISFWNQGVSAENCYFSLVELEATAQQAIWNPKPIDPRKLHRTLVLAAANRYLEDQNYPRDGLQ